MARNLNDGLADHDDDGVEVFAAASLVGSVLLDESLVQGTADDKQLSRPLKEGSRTAGWFPVEVEQISTDGFQRIQRPLPGDLWLPLDAHPRSRARWQASESRRQPLA